jgi:hypothetical protein
LGSEEIVGRSRGRGRDASTYFLFYTFALGFTPPLSRDWGSGGVTFVLNDFYITNLLIPVLLGSVRTPVVNSYITNM